MTTGRLAKKAGIMLLGLVVGAAMLLSFYYADLTTDSYRGQATFQTEAEYTAFKTAIGDGTVTIRDMKSLSSAPPIVVTFDVMVPAHQPFAYGQQVGEIASAGVIGIILAVSMLGVAYSKQRGV